MLQGSRVLAVPGFGDTADYWIPSLPPSLGNIESLRWSGLWGETVSSSPIPVALQQITKASTEDTVLFGHSLGCRLLLQCLPDLAYRHIILLAPALGQYSFLQPEMLSSWEKTGVRGTFRLDPSTGEVCRLDIPYSYAEGLLALSPSPHIPSDVTVILLSEDTRQNILTRKLLTGSVVEIDGPHRWWEDSDTAVKVRETVSAVVSSLD